MDSVGWWLLLDWWGFAVESFFGVIYVNLMGLISCCRYRWMCGWISDYWDEVFILEGFDGYVFVLDD